jgi:hypothetical protein
MQRHIHYLSVLGDGLAGADFASVFVSAVFGAAESFLAESL